MVSPMSAGARWRTLPSKTLEVPPSANYRTILSIDACFIKRITEGVLNLTTWTATLWFQTAVWDSPFRHRLRSELATLVPSVALVLSQPANRPTVPRK